MAIYWFSFTPNPTDSANLSPTFLNFIKFDGTTLPPPGVTQVATGTGIYQFTYTPSFSIAFRIDGATTGLTASSRYIRNSIDPLDQLDVQVAAGATQVAALGATVVAQGATIVGIGTTLIAQGATIVGIGVTQIAEGATIVAIGNTLIGIGNTLGTFGASITVVLTGIGSTTSIYGGASLEPGDLFGYMKWTKEFLSGNQAFNKTNGAWSIYARNNATLLITKSLTNDVNGVTRG